MAGLVATGLAASSAPPTAQSFEVDTTSFERRAPLASNSLASSSMLVGQEEQRPYTMVPIRFDEDGNMVQNEHLAGGDPRQQLGNARQQGFRRAGELCALPQFKEAMQKLSNLLPGAIEKAGGMDAVTQYYAANQASNMCVSEPSSGHGQARHWPPSQGAWPRLRLDGLGPVRGLLLNAGSGETGMPFLGCVMDSLGLRRLGRGTAEWREERKKLHGLCGLLPEAAEHGNACTRLWDEYDYVDDWPVEDQLVQLLATHPGERTAGVLLSLRDPWEWRRARLSGHVDAGAADWTAPSPCSGHGPRLDQDEAPLAKLSHDVWAACVGGERSNGVFAFNLREELPGGDFGSQLHAYLTRDGVQFANYTREQFMHASDECSHLKNWD